LTEAGRHGWIRARVLTWILLVALAVPAASRAAPPLLVFAAASMTDAMGEVITRWNGQGSVRAVASFAASSTLARQIEHGAPAAVYVSASTSWMDHLERRGAIVPATRVDVASNELALVAPADTVFTFALARGAPLAERLAGGRLALADPDHVPAGMQARQALEHLGLWAGVAPHVARASDVRAALAFVARGEAPLGVVYVTDARASRRVRLVATFPPGSHEPIRYPAAVVAAHDAPAARAFVRFLRSPEAAAVFAARGFGSP
jgi:molybdate transport system substrate-binding protein